MYDLFMFFLQPPLLMVALKILPKTTKIDLVTSVSILKAWNVT